MLPPPTSLDAPTAQESNSDQEDSDLEVDLSKYAVDSDRESAVAEDKSFVSRSTVDPERESKDKTTPKKKPGQKVAGFLKRAVRAGVGGALSVDQVKAAVGSEPAKRRVGAVSDPPLTDISDAEVTTDPTEVENAIAEASSETQDPQKTPKKLIPGPIENGEGPSVFSARMHGKRGHVVIINSAVSPCVAFAYIKSRKALNLLLQARNKEIDPTDIHAEFTVALNEIVGLRKVGAFGWKGKIVVGWALGREIVDGLEIMDKTGKAVTLTAIRGRDELFNRLIAVGRQNWECW